MRAYGTGMLSVLPWILVAIVLVGAAISIGVRRAPSDPGVWHVDPLTAPTTGKPNWYRLLPADAPGDRDPDRDAAAPVFAQSAATVASAFNRVALDDDLVVVLAGSADDGFVTYVQRSRLFGFPDYNSVRFIDLPDDGSTLAFYARARFGQSDLDVNRKRVEKWVGETVQQLA